MKKGKKIPIRTCLGCGAKQAKKKLLRFSLNVEGRLTLDKQSSLPGRGIYCCNKRECFTIFMKNRRKACKALRLQELLIDEELKGLFGSK